MAREHSGAQPLSRRGTTARKHSPASLGFEVSPAVVLDETKTTTDDEADGGLAHLTERFKKVQQDKDLAEIQIMEEDREFDLTLKTLETHRDDLRRELKERDEASNELRRQVHKLESAHRTAQSEKSKKERLLQQKESQHKKRQDEVIKWDDQISSMTEEMAGIKTQKAAIEKRAASDIRELRQKIEEEQREVQILEEENKDKVAQLKALEEERTRLNQDEETDESREADRQERERDQHWQEKMLNLQATYTALFNAVHRAKVQYRLARERLTWMENSRRATTTSSHPPLSPLDIESTRGGIKPRRTRQSGSLASSISSPTTNFTPLDSYPASGPFQSTLNTSPTFSSPSFFNLKNGMTLVTPSDIPTPAMEGVDALVGGAPMSPRADSLLPANLLGDESADDEADNEAIIPIQPSVGTAFNGVRPSSLLGDGPAQRSPSPKSSSSRSFSSPCESFANSVDPDRTSQHSGRPASDRPGRANNPQSASRKLVSGLFSFSRQRGKTIVDEPPALGSLKQGQSQSFPRNLGEGFDPLAQGRRRLSYGGNWAFPMSRAAHVGKDPNSGRLAPARRGFPSLFAGFGKSSTEPSGYDPFGARNDPLESSMINSIRGDTSSPRPSSTYSFDKLPRPSVECQFHAWGPHESSRLRGSPLGSDWTKSHSWSQHHSRRPSGQYASSSNLTLGAPQDEDFLGPPRELQEPLQAPIGTRPTSSRKQPITPRLNPAAPAFTFFGKKTDKNKDKQKPKEVARERQVGAEGIDDLSPPKTRQSRDMQSVATTGSTAESRLSLERTSSTPSESNPAENTSTRETFIHKLITRKSSSSKFGSWKDKGGLFSRKGESSTPNEVEEDGATSDPQLGKSVESTSTTPSGDREERSTPRGSRSSLSWSFMKRAKKGGKEDLAASEISENSERVSEMGDEDIAEGEEKVHH